MISAEFRPGPQVHNFPQAILNVNIIKIWPQPFNSRLIRFITQAAQSSSSAAVDEDNDDDGECERNDNNLDHRLHCSV